jgi:isoleucyl-tRNA synthetase
LAITTASLGRAARGAADIKLRQPLAKARVNVGTLQAQQDLMELDFVLQEEINVKEIEVVSEVGDLVSYVVLPNSRSLGPKFGKLFPQVRQALAAENPSELARTLQDGGTIQLTVAGEAVELTGEDVLVQTESKGGTAVASDKGVTVAVDTELSPELIQEGYARDIVRQVNNGRKDAGLEISDRIDLGYEAEGEVAAAFAGFADFIRQETLTLSLEAGSLKDPIYMETVKIGDQEVVLALRKA